MDRKLRMQLLQARRAAKRAAWRNRVGMVLAVMAAALVVGLVAYGPTDRPHGYPPRRPGTADQLAKVTPQGGCIGVAALVLPAGGSGDPVGCSARAYRDVMAALHDIAPTCEQQGQGASAWAEANNQQPHGYEVLARCEGVAPRSPDVVTQAGTVGR